MQQYHRSSPKLLRKTLIIIISWTKIAQMCYSTTVPGLIMEQQSSMFKGWRKSKNISLKQSLYQDINLQLTAFRNMNPSFHPVKLSPLYSMLKPDSQASMISPLKENNFMKFNQKRLNSQNKRGHLECKLTIHFTSREGISIKFTNWNELVENSFKEIMKSSYPKLVYYHKKIGVGKLKNIQISNKMSPVLVTKFKGTFKKYKKFFDYKISKLLKNTLKYFSAKINKCELLAVKEYINDTYLSYFQGFSHHKYIQKIKIENLKIFEKIQKNKSIKNARANIKRRQILIQGSLDRVIFELSERLTDFQVKKILQKILVIFLFFLTFRKSKRMEQK